MKKYARIRGRRTFPIINNELDVPYGSTVLDTAAGYGVDLYKLGLMYNGTRRINVDKSVILSNEVFDGREFSLGRAKQVSMGALNVKDLPECEFYQGDARDLDMISG